MIDLNINEKQLKSTVKRCKERNIIIPTFEQMKNPETIPEDIKKELKNIGLWDINPRNLFRITWKNEPTHQGGLYDGVNYIELPESITGVKARIIALIGKWFPTGAHKVGATFGCLVPRLITGQFDPSSQKAVWPSTGNYCRGGAYDSALLACESIAILPEEMSNERFDWLNNVAGEVIATPGCESNVKEIYDKCWELRKERDDIVIFNQFDEFGNYLWHYEITGKAIKEVLDNIMNEKDRFAGVTLTTGSAGTIACGDFLKKQYPYSKIAASEALQCPTLLLNGYGGHRIEGIGDKHIPWIHNVKNTDMVIAVDDNDCMNIIRLFNEPEGKEYLKSQGLSDSMISELDLIGISGVANLLSAIKFAKYYELGENDIVATVFTDSMELYSSRIKEMNEKYGKYNRESAAVDYNKYLIGQKTDNVLELNYYDRRRIHNLKYYTWIEQQAKDLKELNAQWYDYENYWEGIRELPPKIDELIKEFNNKTGLI
ncbi:MAG: pyridoxal-phosphate dependent enzyme [Spirochaetota bacterium]